MIVRNFPFNPSIVPAGIIWALGRRAWKLAASYTLIFA
jgi:hypothetical protein